jgi:hypothetical protein
MAAVVAVVDGQELALVVQVEMVAVEQVAQMELVTQEQKTLAVVVAEIHRQV